jgi:hypothetical protein
MGPAGPCLPGTLLGPTTWDHTQDHALDHVRTTPACQGPLPARTPVLPETTAWDPACQDHTACGDHTARPPSLGPLTCQTTQDLPEFCQDHLETLLLEP